MTGDTPSRNIRPGNILNVQDLKVYFPVHTGGVLIGKYRPLKAVDGVSFTLKEGETLGIVGESGCGKSTLGRAILGLLPATSGKVIWMDGPDLAALDGTAMRPFRQDIQIIFQDPLASLNPRMTVGDIIAEPLTVFEPDLTGLQRKDRVRQVMEQVGLSPEMINRYPHEFSGGQCQRIGIGRAMILNPKVIICDEAVAALDVSIQAQIINLLAKMQRAFGVALIFISHDLSIVRHISHRVMVLYLGRVMEMADCEALFAAPRHPYTRLLISAVPAPDPDIERGKAHTRMSGELPSPLDPPSGCVFRTRCPKAAEICRSKTPLLEDKAPGHQVACHFPD